MCSRGCSARIQRWLHPRRTPTYKYVYTLTLKPDGAVADNSRVSVKFYDHSKAHICSKSLKIPAAAGDVEFDVSIYGKDFEHTEYVELQLRGHDRVSCEQVAVKCIPTEREMVFPLRQDIPRDGQLTLHEKDPVLPQYDTNQNRQAELEARKKLYAGEIDTRYGMLVVKKVPKEEKFKYGRFELEKMRLLTEIDVLEKKITRPGAFTKLDDYKHIFDKVVTFEFPEPKGMKNWRSDVEFGRMRLVGCNPVTIRLCTKIPHNFKLSEADLQPYMEGKSIKHALKEKKLFIIDHSFLKDVKHPEGRDICAPMALFFVNREKDLVPVAIQLFPDPADGNPVFYPTDPEYTWLMAKSHFNCADASVHQALTHLCFTHLIGESIVVATNQCLSTSHPLHVLLAPHFLFLLEINDIGIKKLFEDGGWVELTMAVGPSGMFEIMKNKWATWRLDVEGNLLADLKKRGVYDPEVLPNYYFRDDAPLLREAIRDYVQRIVEFYYTSEDVVAQDWELQAWGKFLSESPTDENPTVGMQGIPNNGKFETVDEITDTVTNFVYLLSVGHAAANFGQYDQYAFTPNYPAWMHGEPPKNKVSLTEEDLIEQLPPKNETLRVMQITKVLSTRVTCPLGYYEFPRNAGRIGKGSQEIFRADLDKVSDIIDSRNKERKHEYTILHPGSVPNAISI